MNIANKYLNSKNKIIFTVLVLVLFVITIVIAIFIFNRALNPQPVIKVGDIAVTSKDYDRMLQEYEKTKIPENIKKEQVADFIVDTLSLRLIAKDVGIETNQEEIKLMADNIYNNSTEKGKYSAWNLIVAENKVYKTKITNIGSGNKVIARLSYPFSRYFGGGQETIPEGFGDEKKINEDKLYAKEKVTKAHEALASKTTTEKATELIESAQADKRLTYGHAGNRSEIVFYNSNEGKTIESITDQLSLSDIDKTRLNNLNSGVSDIFEETKAANYSSVKGYSYEGVPVSYYFYALLDNGKSNLSVMKKVEVLKQQIAVKKNV